MRTKGETIVLCMCTLHARTHAHTLTYTHKYIIIYLYNLFLLAVKCILHDQQDM